MRKILIELFNHDRYETISIILASVLLLFFFGCEPTCQSILEPGNTSSRSELDAEIEMMIARANAGYASLEKQESLRQLLFNQTIASASTGTFNPIALLTSIGAIFGVGATVDNVRNRKKIKKLESET